MDFRRLHTFRTVAALRSFSGAAKALHCSQSTASTQIKILEKELGTALFERLGTGIALTKAGEAYLAYANKILSIQEEARYRLGETSTPAVTLSLRMPQSLSERYFPEILARFQETYPRVGFDVSVCAFSELHAELRTGVTDAAFLLADEAVKEDLLVRCLATVELVFVSAPGWHAPDAGDFELADLEHARVFIPKHDCSYRMRLSRLLLEENVRPRALVECNSLTMLKQCVARGLGTALLPAFCVEEERRRGELAALSSSSVRLETGLLMIRHKNAWMSDELRHFLFLCEEAFASAR